MWTDRINIRPSAARLDLVAGAEADNTGLPLRLRGLENRTVGERLDVGTSLPWPGFPQASGW